MANDKVKKSESLRRLQLVLEESKSSSFNALARELGIKRGENLYQITRGNNGISKDLADKICARYPQFSKAWLLTGEGEPYIEIPLPQTTPITIHLDINQANLLMTQLEFWLKGNIAK